MPARPSFWALSIVSTQSEPCLSHDLPPHLPDPYLRPRHGPVNTSTTYYYIWTSPIALARPSGNLGRLSPEKPNWTTPYSIPRWSRTMCPVRIVLGKRNGKCGRDRGITRGSDWRIDGPEDAWPRPVHQSFHSVPKTPAKFRKSTCGRWAESHARHNGLSSHGPH